MTSPYPFLPLISIGIVGWEECERDAEKKIIKKDISLRLRVVLEENSNSAKTCIDGCDEEIYCGEFQFQQ